MNSTSRVPLKPQIYTKIQVVASLLTPEPTQNPHSVCESHRGHRL